VLELIAGFIYAAGLRALDDGKFHAISTTEVFRARVALQQLRRVGCPVCHGSGTNADWSLCACLFRGVA
jgi:mono/diheme cytochrome c family protein